MSYVFAKTYVNLNPIWDNRMAPSGVYASGYDKSQKSVGRKLTEEEAEKVRQIIFGNTIGELSE